MHKTIHLSLAQMSGYEQDFIKEAFDTNWVAPLGPNVNALEKDLMIFLKENRPVVALSSGTAALHLALVQTGTSEKDEVICQSFTFAASANPVIYQHATPIFIDSEKETWNMCPNLLEKAIQDRINKTGRLPKAIIPVHLYGMPAKMSEIMEIAEYYHIPIIEDAAEALGSEYKGRMCGTFGDFGVLSFNGNKIITTSGGGALICRNIKQAEEILFYSTQARDNAPHYQHSHVGYNYRMSNICAGIGRGQMVVLDKYIARRRAIHYLYMDLLEEIDGITVQDAPSETYDSNFWLTCIQINKTKTGIDREQLRLYLATKNIESRPLWKPMHLQPVFSHYPFYGSNISAGLFNHGLCLPSGSGLTDEDIEYIAGNIIECIKNKKRHSVYKRNSHIEY